MFSGRVANNLERFNEQKQKGKSNLLKVEAIKEKDG